MAHGSVHEMSFARWHHFITAHTGMACQQYLALSKAWWFGSLYL